MSNTITKNQTANVGKYSYRYVDIAQIHEYLESIEVSYYQYVESDNGNDYIITVPIDKDGKELGHRKGCRIVDATLVGVSNPAQQQGSAITYARRYSLLMAFGLATDDDDAQSLSTPKEITEEYAKNYVLTFGKYKDMTLNEIYIVDEDYIKWLYGNDKTNPEIKQCIEKITGITKEDLQDRLKLMVEIKKLMEQKNIRADEVYDKFNKNSNDMSDNELIEVKSWLKEL